MIAKRVLWSLLLLLGLHSATVAVPSAVLSTCVVPPPPAGCQYRFRTDGGLDVLTVTVTLLDAGGAPEVGWPVSCSLLANAGTIALCSCCPLLQLGVTGPGGVAVFAWGKVGGRGSLDVSVATGSPAAWAIPVSFTSPDLSASCEAAPAGATNILDLGIWAGALPPSPYDVTSDFSCDGQVNIVDLGLWASGLGKGCAPPCP